ncbi:MAG: hypothetical protein WCO04_06050 [Pseudomonadota bacterium]
MGKITSGNFWPRAGAIEALVDEFVKSGLDRLLISSESIFDVIGAKETKFIGHLRAFFPDAKINMLCFVRDPVDHAISAYQQMVKRGGYRGSFSGSLLQYDVIPKCRTVFSRLKDADVSFKVFNYSRHEKRIALDIEDWLGLPSGSLETPLVDRVNRSMTRAELKLQSEFNKYFGAFASQIISDPLCNLLPNVKSEIPEISLKELSEFVDRVRDDLQKAKLEDFMPSEEVPLLLDAETYLSQFAVSEQNHVYGFSAHQIEIIVESIATSLHKLKTITDRGDLN